MRKPLVPANGESLYTVAQSLLLSQRYKAYSFARVLEDYVVLKKLKHPVKVNWP